MTKKWTDHVKRKNIGWINQKGKYFLAANISHKTYKPVTVRKNSNIYRIHKHIKKDVSYVHRRISFHCGSSISYNYPFWFIIYGIYFCFCCCSSFFNPKIFFYWRSIWWHIILYDLRWPFQTIAAYHYYILQLIENNVIVNITKKQNFILTEFCFATDLNHLLRIVVFPKILVYSYTLRN